MSVYYNEIDPFAAAWLRELIQSGHIAPGEVDERSITDVQVEDLKEFTQCHFFAGIGVWSYALRRAGWPDDRPVWTGSCPCQPWSIAGHARGTGDDRHLWPEWFRLLRQHRPLTVFGEQVASRDGLAWFDLVSADMEGENYACGAVDTCAAGFGAPHVRQRLYWMDHAKRERWEGRLQGRAQTQREMVNRYAGCNGTTGPDRGMWETFEWVDCRDGKCRPVEPGTFPLAYGSSARVGRLRGYGNAIVTPQAAWFVKAAMAELAD